MTIKYLTAIMNVVSVGEAGFVFFCDHATIGEVDDKTGIFKDSSGKQYIPMLSPDLFKNNYSQVYFSLTKIEDAMKDTEYRLSADELVKLFEDVAKENFYYIGLTEEGKVYFLMFDKNQLLKEKKGISNLRNIEEKESSTSDEYRINLELEQLLNEIMDDKYSVYEYDKILENIEVTNQLTKKITDAVNSKIEQDYVIDNEKEEKEKKIDIEDIYKKVTRTLIAQEEPARRVITEIARKEMDPRKKKEGILLVGPTGVGKTELMRLIAKYIDRPFFKVDSTQLTMPGYVGKDIEEVLWDLYEKCGEDLKKTEQAIVFFDEIDKKGSSQKSDVSGKGVLNVLLSFIEGTTYDACANVKQPTRVVKINTSNMTVIFGGAYSEIYKNVEKKDLGFLKDTEEEKKKELVSTDNFINCGMMSNEFMSRVTVIKLNELDVNAIKRIMLESDESAMRIQQEIFEKLGVKLTFTDGYTTAVAKNAYEKKTGARGLNGIIDESTWRAFEAAYSHPEYYEEFILDENILDNPQNYQYVKKKH